MSARRFLPPFTATLLLLLLWSLPADAFTREDVKTAVALNRAGQRAAALELYDLILADDRAALAVPNDGLLAALLLSYEQKVLGGDPALRFRFAVLNDLAGRVDRARDLYAALALDGPREWAGKARANLKTLDRELQTYYRYLAGLRATSIAENRAIEDALVRRLAAERAPRSPSAAQVATGAETARDAADVVELTRRITITLDELAALKQDAWRAKRDWNDNAATRPWRAGADDVPGSYTGTLRRRTREADAAVVAKDLEIDALKISLKTYR